MAEQPNAPVTTGLDLGYQWIEPLAQEEGSHHGGSATVGVGAPLGDWVSLGLALHGAAMTHPDDEMGADNSGTGFPVATLRVLDTRQALSYGVSLEAVFPGRDAPSIDFAATTLRGTAMATYAPAGSWAYAFNLGYLLDNSAEAAPPIATLRQGDRTALGASSFEAVSIGVGVARSSGPWLLFGEASADLLYAAPRLGTSPMRVGAGARYAVTDSVQLELRARVGLSARQGFDPQQYQPFEPRIAVSFGPRIAWGAPDTMPLPPNTVTQRPPSEPKPTSPKATQPVAVAHHLVGVVTDDAGAPLAQVTITAKQGEWSRTTETGFDGTYELSSIPSGELEITAQTVDYQPFRYELRVEADAPETTAPPVKLQLQVLGAQIEGIVRGFDGKIPEATITLTPGERTSKTDADGKFQLEVGPGEYRVIVSAPGYETQTRSVIVQKQGVVIVNVDLRTR